MGEVATDVAQRRRAEQRIANRVEQDVGVGMAEQAGLTWEFPPLR